MTRWPVLSFALLVAGCLDAPPSAAGGVSDTCGTVRSLRDPFDAVSDPWEQHGSTVDGGVLVLEAGPDESSWVITRWAYLLDGGEMTVALRRAELTGDGELRIYLVTADDDSIGLQLQAGVLSVLVDVAGDATSPASIDWQPDQLWWRLRQTSGLFEWAVSTDGEEWSEQQPVDDPLGGPVFVLIEAYGGTGQASAELEAINPEVSESACPASSFADDFESESPRWTKTGAADCEVFAAGQLHMGTDAAEPCGVYTLEQFDMTGSSAAIEALEVDDCDPSLSFAVDLPALAVEMRCLDVDGIPTLIGGMYGDAVDSTFVNVEYDPMLHRYWRIANPPGSDQIELATADDSGVWSTLGSRPIDTDQLARAEIDILAVDESPDGQTGQIVVDNLNRVPP